MKGGRNMCEDEVLKKLQFKDDVRHFIVKARKIMRLTYEDVMTADDRDDFEDEIIKIENKLDKY